VVYRNGTLVFSAFFGRDLTINATKKASINRENAAGRLKLGVLWDVGLTNQKPEKPPINEISERLTTII
jgi:hypothetical protein